MSEGLDSTKRFRAKVQRNSAGAVLGACLAIGAEDISFVDSDTEYLTITKRTTEEGLILEIGGETR